MEATEKLPGVVREESQQGRSRRAKPTGLVGQAGQAILPGLLGWPVGCR
jgi:hypothetical protein